MVKLVGLEPVTIFLVIFCWIREWLLSIPNSFFFCGYLPSKPSLFLFTPPFFLSFQHFHPQTRSGSGTFLPPSSPKCALRFLRRWWFSLLRLDKFLLSFLRVKRAGRLDGDKLDKRDVKLGKSGKTILMLEDQRCMPLDDEMRTYESRSGLITSSYIYRIQSMLLIEFTGVCLRWGKEVCWTVEKFVTVCS